MPLPQRHEGIAHPLIPWDYSTDLYECQPLSAVVNCCQNLNRTPFTNHFGVKAAHLDPQRSLNVTKFPSGIAS